ncbi:MAG: hypothetical protein RL095_3688 [Verrucomicrobiota bacterium]|jgi:serine/threonine protein kinase
MSEKTPFDALYRQAMAMRDAPACGEIPDELQQTEWFYEDDELIKEGGMKRVIRCRDRRSDRLVARAEMLHPEVDAEKFLREARITAQLQHPNIMPVYEIGSKKGEIYFTMKLVEGTDLESILQLLCAGDKATIEAYTLERRLEIFNRICDAMAYAHRRGVIHLDLKPSNIQVSGYGEVLVSDWGLARVMDSVCEDPGLVKTSLSSLELRNTTCDGYIKGSPGFMSPEQAGGPRTFKGECSDIYALGAILYSLLCFDAPVQGESIEEVLINTRHGLVVPLDRYRDRLLIPSALESICMKALSVRPENRYASVEELQRDLNAYRYGFATSAEKAGFLRQLWLLIKRHQRTVAVICSASLILFVITLVFISHLHRKEAQAQEARKLAESREIALRQETERSLAYARDAAKTWQTRAETSASLFDLEKAAHFNELAVTFGNRPEAWNFKAILHLIQLDFHDAVEAAKHCPAGSPFVNALRLSAEEYAAKYPRGTTPDFSDWLTLYQRIQRLPMSREEKEGNGPFILGRMTYSWFKRNHPPEARLAMVTKMLKSNNPDLKNLKIDYRENRLDLANNAALKWAGALQFFPATELDISHTSFASLWQLNGMNLRSLNLQDCPIQSLKELCPKGGRDDDPPTSTLSLSLEEIDLRGTGITDFHPLVHCLKLRLVKISKKQESIFFKYYRAKLPEDLIVEVDP